MQKNPARYVAPANPERNAAMIGKRISSATSTHNDLRDRRARSRSARTDRAISFEHANA